MSNRRILESKKERVKRSVEDLILSIERYFWRMDPITVRVGTDFYKADINQIKLAQPGNYLNGYIMSIYILSSSDRSIKYTINLPVNVELIFGLMSENPNKYRSQLKSMLADKLKKFHRNNHSDELNNQTENSESDLSKQNKPDVINNETSGLLTITFFLCVINFVFLIILLSKIFINQI